jgi:4-hydroxymandelate oxidase
MAAATGPVWFQLYVFRDRAISASLVQRAETAGCNAVVLTVDVPVAGRRERDVRNRLTLPDHLSLINLLSAGCQELPKNVAGSGLAAYVASLFDAALTWKDIEWLAGVTKLPILVKGILRADDALRAVNCGASGIIVSNHGARQLDTTPATISVLPEIVDAVAGAWRSVEKPGSSTFWSCCVRSSIWLWRCRAARGLPPSPEILSVPCRTPDRFGQ